MTKPINTIAADVQTQYLTASRDLTPVDLAGPNEENSYQCQSFRLDGRTRDFSLTFTDMAGFVQVSVLDSKNKPVLFSPIVRSVKREVPFSNSVEAVLLDEDKSVLEEWMIRRAAVGNGLLIQANTSREEIIEEQEMSLATSLFSSSLYVNGYLACRKQTAPASE